MENNTKKPRILIIGGYARSGKSTFIKMARAADISAASTSELLDFLCYRVYLSLLMDWSNETILEEDFLDSLSKKSGLVCKDERALKIAVAEEVVVPLFGRKEGIVRPTVEYIKQSEDDVFVIESIGGEEFDILIDMLGKDKYDIQLLNIVTEKFNNVDDIRQLLPTENVMLNNCADVKEWEKMCANYIDKFVQEG